MNKLNFIRSELDKLAAYTPHPGGKVTTAWDRLDTNESPYDLPKELKEKLAWIYENQLENNRYPDGSHGELKEAIAEYVNESANLNQGINSENISVGNGSDELIRSLLIATCLGGNGSILVANPTFSMYEIIAQTLGIPVVSIQRDETDFSLDLAAAQKAIEQTKNPPIRVVFVVHPNSPTANILKAKEIKWLQNLSQDILVVIDEAYFEFSQTSLVEEREKQPNWVILRTFSKAFRLATHRVGYAIAHSELITALEKIRLPYNLPSFSQTAALFALKHRHLLLPSTTETIQERERIINTLTQNSNLKIWPSAANFIYLRLTTDSIELNQLSAALKTAGTLVRHTGGGIRITVGSPPENTRTIQRIEQILTQLGLTH
ncbi:MAG: histidinol-phosphate transaminase [Gomphosphaeria aponina SAG 52.96 = DSM 107014]|uniref:Histidinol-phosphate aminotransferase n=1 Tax=Gomphosphaeria aponina SAG 52.96 = DSM 107014 TaxID=1521640 RepID=A0A941GMT1_9CHRO|nr:histidinol-phosphate transaminase [Gomphosphaeria aponina SAG 52.96 = DSM 107014]